jgi:hypothetical protein
MSICYRLIKKNTCTAGWLAQQNIKMKRLKRKNERERDRDKGGSNMFAHGHKYCIH